MKKLMLLLISVWLLTAGCIYYPYADSTYNYDTDSGYNYSYGNYYPYYSSPYYSSPYYYYPYYYPGGGHRSYYGPRRWR